MLQKQFLSPLHTSVAVVTCCRQFLWRPFTRSKPSLLLFCKQPVLSWPSSTSSFQLSCSLKEHCVTSSNAELSFRTESADSCDISSTFHGVVTSLEHANRSSRNNFPCLSWTGLFEKRVKEQKCLRQLHWAPASLAYQRWSCISPASIIRLWLQIWDPGPSPSFLIWSSGRFQVLSHHRNIPFNAPSCVELRRPRKTFQRMWNEEIKACLRK